MRAKALPCHVVPDGATLRIDDWTAYEPDAMVYCGPKPSPSSLLVENPVVIVEILSPSTERIDRRRKLADYFRVVSVEHYLIIDPDDTLVIHHQRHGGDLLTRLLREGTIALDPPGLELTVAEIYAAAGA